uniref:SJCHGC04593 protein n=1 Tax=Schistosoma japonicum TaxID=6182 RepID=Q5D8N7_SCHJA|nr:SJCHGC04593 protein [Schistosoma japonicum]
MAYLLENVIFVTKNEDVKENLVSTFKQFKNSNIITQVDPAKFMDEQFIAGFCRRGVVTVLPLKPLPEFHLSIEKSVLTLDMSPVIYSGFGLSAKRMKQGKKQFFYRFQVDLNSPKFQRNGPLHKRLQSFFRAFTNPSELGTRIPHCLANLGPFFVDWLPDSSVTQINKFPKIESIASYLNNEEHIVIQPQYEVFDYSGPPIQIPELISWDKFLDKQKQNTCTKIEETSDFLNIVNIRLGLTVLSYLAAGISFPHSSVSNCEPSDNPCLSNSTLSPIYTQTLNEILSPVYKLEKLKIIYLSGLFLDCCYYELEDKIKFMLTESQCEDELIYMCKCSLRTTTDSIQSLQHSVLPLGTLFLTGRKGTLDSQCPPLIKIRF